MLQEGSIAFNLGIGKVSQRKAMPKNVQTTAIALISHTIKVILEILQARL